LWVWVFGGVTTPFTWDPTGIGTLLSDGDRYLWGHGPIGRIDASSTVTYAHQDGLGSVRLITDATGAVVGSSAYDAFGTQRATTGVQYRLGFTGEQRDAETGFIYLRARYYDPGQGSFPSQGMKNAQRCTMTVQAPPSLGMPFLQLSRD
jgi:RHS repeat-associated protein